MLLVDTNVWLELLLEQERAGEARAFFVAQEGRRIAITDFSVDSIGVILCRLNKDELLDDFISDTLEDTAVTRIRLDVADLRRLLEVRREFRLDYDDAYQYVAAEKHNLALVSYDSDFDRTTRGRTAPADNTKAS